MAWPPATSRGLVQWAAGRYGDAEALVHGDRRFSFRQLLEASCRLAAGLAARGIRRSDRVGMWLPNWPEWLFARHALGILGAVAVPINTRYKADELASCLRQGECRALLSADRFLGIDFRAMVDSVPGSLPMLEWAAYPDEVAGMLVAEALTPERISGVNLAGGPGDEALFRPLPEIEVRIVDPDTGRTQPVGKEGEIHIRGTHVTPGYFKMPKETAALLLADGWMRTGDLGRQESPGLFRFLSRLKEVLKTGGFLVAPLEVEAVLMTHPAVAEACVIPKPDPRLGEVGLAVVQLSPGHSTSETELLQLCGGRLANIKVPRQVVFVEEYPRTATGKIQRARLKERWISG